MVRTAFFFILIFFSLTGEEVNVTSEMNYTDLVTGKPLTGTITITHNKQQQVDASSFKLGNEPLKTSFLNNVVISEESPLIISIYAFEIATQPKGLHVLPQVSVKVGGKLYKSYSRSYEVFGEAPPPQAPPLNAPQVNTPAPPPEDRPSPKAATNSTETTGNPSLRLETKVEGGTRLFPGQKVTFTYRFLYNGHIDLTKEELPLLEGAGLTKVGDKQVKDYEENGLSVFESSQKFEAESPGVYQFGPSIVEGLVSGTSNKLHSETAPLLIEVMPFPGAGKPASFNGAIGQFSFKASLNSAPSLNAGEKLTLLLEMSGTPESLSTVKAPDLCCQPGFPGNFKPSDLPPMSRVSNGVKSFLVDLTPLSSNISTIPPIEFSSFDPATNKYLVQKSAPIPITVILKAAAHEKNETKQEEMITSPSANLVQPIEISGHMPLSKSDLQNKPFGSWWNLLWLPVFLALIYFQLNMKKELDQKKPLVKKTPSSEILKKALTDDPGSAPFYKSVQEALLAALAEKGLIASAEIDPQELPQTGLTNEVRLFIARLDELKFSGKRQFNQAIIISLKELYQKIISG